MRKKEFESTLKDLNFPSSNEGFLSQEDFESFYHNNKSTWLSSLPDTEVINEIKTEIPKPNANLQPIENILTAPYRFICKLILHQAPNMTYGGTGFLISPYHVLTAGHCILPTHGNHSITRVDVIPGLDGEDAPFGWESSQTFSVSKKWRKSRSQSHDYGLISLPNDNLFQRLGGHFLLYPNQYKRLNVFGGGYVDADPPDIEYAIGFQGITRGRIKRVFRHSVSFSNQLHPGYSGGPIYLQWSQNDFTYYLAIAIAAYKYRYNYGPRVSEEMIQELNQMGNNQIPTLL